MFRKLRHPSPEGRHHRLLYSTETSSAFSRKSQDPERVLLRGDASRMLTTSTALVLGATLLCFSQWMSSAAATPGLGADCPCPYRSDTRIQLSKVVDYTIQHEGICPLRVLMVHTLSGGILCSNPDTKWAEMVMFKVQMDRVTKELQRNALITAGPLDTITPTPATTPAMTSETTRLLTKERVKCLKKHQKKKFRKGKKQRICP